MSDEAFAGVVQEFVDFHLGTNPHIATSLGVHKYDSLLPDGSRGGVLREIDRWKDFRSRFASIDPEGLTGSRPLDRELAVFLLDLWIYQGEELRLWEALPTAPDVVGSALFPLLALNFAPLEVRLESITGRLKAIPQYLMASRERISRPVKLWGGIALESGRALPSFMVGIEGSGAVLRGPERETLQDALRGAREAIEEYNGWLEGEVIPKGSDEPYIGREAYSRILELRQLGFGPDAIRELGIQYLKQGRDELKALAARIDPGAPMDMIRQRIKQDHPPTFEEVLEATRQSMEEARNFARDRKIVTLPVGEELAVTETPSFLRHLAPFAFYLPPGRWERKKEGIYMVTPPDGPPERLAEHNRPSIRNRTVHEAYPGHHVQLLCASLNPSYLRPLVGDIANAEMVEGWAHYCEELMGEEGFDATPEGQFIRLNDGIWRACRVVIDVGLHCGDMGFEEAVEMLEREVGMERAAAEAEVKRYSVTPTYALSYLFGKHMIKELRGEVRGRLAERFTLRFFHDTILYSGSLPLALLRKVFQDRLAALEEEPHE
jgi:uncharacterized protein (DUF885 family)